MRIIICGRGGQGIVTISMLLGALASGLGHNVISAETHGMAMRGGSVYTSLKINEGLSAAIEEMGADVIISMDETETTRNLKYLKNNGLILNDGEYPLNNNYKVININAKKIAMEKFNDLTQAGSIMLGKFIGLFPELLPIDRSLEILRTNKKINIEAVKYGGREL